MTLVENALDFDLIDVEVHQKSLRNIAKEMAITLMRTSGSPVVTDAKDFSTCILDANGEQLAFSGFISFHVSTAVLGVRAVMNRVPKEKLRPGDAFACNDPHTSGAVHQGDLGIVMPFFFKGELIGWGYVNEHVLDIGGSAISGFAAGALDVYSESLAFPGTRIAENGRIDSEWEAFIANNVRVSNTVMNDLRSMIAANNAGQRRLEGVLETMGLERYTALNEESKSLSEKGMRQIISDLPDGTYESMDWVEYDARGTEELHEITARVVIEGDEMTIQFRGGPQTNSFINGATPGMIGQSWTTILAQLAYDIPINAGLWRPVHFDLGPKGTMVNSVSPAPVTMSHIQTGMKVNRLLSDIFSQACSLSPSAAVASRVAGQPAQNQTYFTGSGIDRRTGQGFVSFSMSIGMPAGGPAQTTSDGLEVYGATCMAGTDMPDVEVEELSQPGMILWRRVAPDTAGAGFNRGGHGVATSMAILHTEAMNAGAYSNTTFVPPKGAAGGYLGSAGTWDQLRNTNVVELLETGVYPTEEAVVGDTTPGPAQTANVFFSRGDVYTVVHGGGGGVGDPILRPADRVKTDVADGYVTKEYGEKIYGVVLTDALEVDEAGTDARRAAIRETRIGSKPAKIVREGAPVFSPLGTMDGHWICRMCGEDLGSSTANWRSNSVSIETDGKERLTELGLNMRARSEGKPVVAREHYCPGCASSLGMEVTLKGHGPVPQARPDVYEPYQD